MDIHNSKSIFDLLLGAFTLGLLDFWFVEKTELQEHMGRGLHQVLNRNMSDNIIKSHGKLNFQRGWETEDIRGHLEIKKLQYKRCRCYKVLRRPVNPIYVPFMMNWRAFWALASASTHERMNPLPQRTVTVRFLSCLLFLLMSDCNRDLFSCTYSSRYKHICIFYTSSCRLWYKLR